VSGTPGKGEGIGGPQAVSSLLLTVWKVEVHLARIGIPGAKNTTAPPVEGKPPVTSMRKDNQNVDKWETLTITSPKTIDLVALAKTHDVSSLGLTNLANGHYTEIRLYVSTASATLANGTKIVLSIPGRANIVRVVREFVINTGKTTTLSLDFDAQNSVIRVGDTYILKPVVIRLDQKNQD
jgi:uncharacterized protein DUF4382